jgi:hypothetical protein
MVLTNFQSDLDHLPDSVDHDFRRAGQTGNLKQARLCHSEQPLRLRSGRAQGAKNLYSDNCDLLRQPRLCAGAVYEPFQAAMRILFKWLNRRSQRRSYNWTGFRELLQQFQVERPRIVGRPKPRMAALGAWGPIAEASMTEEPGAGKPHAGPVLSLPKESVRGRLGNWPSYRDGTFLPGRIWI